MTKKLECIKSLKSKLLQMQKQLQKIEGDPIRREDADERMWFNKTSTIKNFNSMMPDQNLTKSPSWKSPTFWGSNPITGKENNTLYSPTKWFKANCSRTIKT